MLYMTAFSFFIIIKNKVIKWSEHLWGWGGEFELAEEDYSAADDKPKAPFRIQIISSSSPSSSSSSPLPRRLHTPVLLPPLPLWSPVMTGGRRLNNKKSLLCSTSCQHQSNRPRWIPVMGNNVSGISTLHRGQQQGFHRLRNSQKGELPEHAS